MEKWEIGRGVSKYTFWLKYGDECKEKFSSEAKNFDTNYMQGISSYAELGVNSSGNS